MKLLALLFFGRDCTFSRFMQNFVSVMQLNKRKEHAESFTSEFSRFDTCFCPGDVFERCDSANHFDELHGGRAGFA